MTFSCWGYYVRITTYQNYQLSELPTIGITNPVSWNSQLIGSHDLKHSELPMFIP